MPPKGKVSAGQDGMSKGLSFFKDEFAKYKANPDDFMKKNGGYAQLERLTNVVDDQQTRRLARLCRARIQYDYCSKKDSRLFVKEREDASMRLRELLTEAPHSSLAACLLAAWWSKGVKVAGDAWSVALKQIEDIRDVCGLTENVNDSEWADPADEAIADEKAFEDFKSCNAKADRLKQLAKYLDTQVKKAKKNAGVNVQQVQQQVQQQIYEASARPPGSQQQQQPDDKTAQEVRGRESEQESRRLEEMRLIERAQEELQQQVALAMEWIGSSLAAAGPEGTEERVKAFCNLFTTSVGDFQKELLELHGETMSSYGIEVQSTLKSFYEKQLTSQIARWRGTGSLLQLRRPDLKEVLATCYNVELGLNATAASAAGGKDVKGDVPAAGSTSGKANANRKGTKGSVKDQDKKAAVAPAAEAAAATSLLNVPDFLDWFVEMLKEHGADIRNKIIDEAAQEAQIPGDGRPKGQPDSEMEHLRKCKQSAGPLTDIFMLQTDSACTDVESSPSSEISNRARRGDVLLTKTVAAEAGAMLSREPSLARIASQRVDFSRQLSELPVLQRHDVMATIAIRIACMSSLEDSGANGSRQLVVPSAFDIPVSLEEAVGRVGDPMTVLDGYVHLMRHRGMLPTDTSPEPWEGLDDTNVRLLRLCGYIWDTKENHPSECILMAMCLNNSTKPEHVDMVRRVCGELPKGLAKRIKQQQQQHEALDKEPNANGDAGADANGTAPQDAVPEGEDPDTNGDDAPAETDDGLAAGSQIEFVIRDDLPAGERAALDDSWRKDILDAVEALREGGCGLGRRLLITLTAYIAEAANVPRGNVELTPEGLTGWVAKLDTERLLHLRFFLLNQLGMRTEAMPTSMKDRFERWNRASKEELWGLELVQGDKIQLSDAAYESLRCTSHVMRRRRIIRLQVLHAMKRILTESKGGAAACGGTPVASSSSASTVAGNPQQQFGSGKKKGKVVGGTSGGPAAAQINEVDCVTLPPLPPGESHLEVDDPEELFDYNRAETLDEAKLRVMLYDDSPVCTREVKELLHIITDAPEKWLDPIGAGPADALVVEEILGTGVPKAYTESYDPLPTFTVTEVLEDLTRASVLEVVRKEAARALHDELDLVLQEWAGLEQHFRKMGEEQHKQFMDELQPRVSGWLLDLFGKAGVSTEEKALVKRLQRLDQGSGRLMLEAFKLQSRVMRFSVLHYAARMKVSTKICEKIDAALQEAKKKDSSASVSSQGREGGKASGRQNKARQGQAGSQAQADDVKRRCDDLEQEKRFATAEKDFLKKMKEHAFHHADTILSQATNFSPLSDLARPRSGLTVFGVTRNQYTETPQGGAQMVLSALQAAQYLAFICEVVEMVIEELQVLARGNLASALVNEPVLDPGVIGTGLPQRWLKNKLEEVVRKIKGDSLVATEKQEKAKNAKKSAEQKKRQEERKREDDEARRREQEEAEAREQQERERQECERQERERQERERQERERQERERQERERQEAREREERESQQRKEKEEQERVAEEAKKKPSCISAHYSEYDIKIDVTRLDEDEAAEAAEKKAATERQKAQQQGGKGTGEARTGGRKDFTVAARLKERDQQQQPQRQQQLHGSADPRGKRDGGAGSSASSAASGGSKREPWPRKGSSGPQQTQQAHPPQSAQQFKHKDGVSGAALGGSGMTAGVAGGAPWPGKDAGGRVGQAPHQTPGGPGKADRGAQPGVQQPHQQGGKGDAGSHGDRGAGGGISSGGGKGPLSGAVQPSQPKAVPGMDPELIRKVAAKPRRNRRGGGGGGGASQGDAASMAAATAPVAATSSAGSWTESTGTFGADDEHLHPPAAAGGQSGVDVVDLTEPEGGPEAQADPVEEHERKYPYVKPYPFEPPAGWKVCNGYLYPEAQDPEALTEKALADQGFTDPNVAESFRRVHRVALANSCLDDAHQKPDVPPEAYKNYTPPQPYPMPYAVPVEIPLSYQQQHHQHNHQHNHQPQHLQQQQPGGAAEGQPLTGVSGSPQLPYAFVLQPPLPAGGLPAPWAQYPGLPTSIPPFMPAFPRPAAAPPGPMPPFHGGPAAPFPYGIPQMLRLPMAPMPGPPEPQGEADSEEQDTEDLLGLLGVQQQPKAAAPTAAAPPVQPALPPFAPGVHGYGVVYRAPMQPYGTPPSVGIQAVPAAPVDVDSGMGEELPPPPVAAPFTPQVPPHPQAHPQARAAVPGKASAALPGLSYAERARAGAGKAAALVGRQGLHRPHDIGDELPDMEIHLDMYQSARDSMNVAFPPLGAAAAGRPGPPPPAAAPSTSQELALIPGGAMGTGLVNRVGEYNCFLNVIIQCLWHCAAFRQQLQARNPADFDAEHPVVAALLRLFRALDAADSAQEQQRQQQLVHSEEAVERHVVDPSELREALDALGVRAGEMNDASEVMGALFESLNRAPGLSGTGTAVGGNGGGAPGAISVVDRTFGLLLSEEVRCTVPTCGRITHVVPQHVEYFIILTATGLRDMRAVIDLAPADVSMGRIIREIEAQNVKRCDNDPPHHGCNTPTRVTRTLHNVPSVFTVQLAWEPDVPGDAIAGTLELVDTVLDPSQIFSGGNCPGNMPTYALHGMFCYYGQHYFAFINRGPVAPEMEHEWVMFDDATVLAVGNWAQVIAKCRAGRIQPSVLFYQQYR